MLSNYMRFRKPQVPVSVNAFSLLEIGRFAHGFAWWQLQFNVTQWSKTGAYRFCQVGSRLVSFNRVVMFGASFTRSPFIFVF